MKTKYSVQRVMTQHIIMVFEILNKIFNTIPQLGVQFSGFFQLHVCYSLVSYLLCHTLNKHKSLCSRYQLNASVEQKFKGVIVPLSPVYLQLLRRHLLVPQKVQTCALTSMAAY